MHGELEPEEHVLPDEDPSEGGKVYPVTPSTTQLLGDVSFNYQKHYGIKERQELCKDLEHLCSEDATILEEIIDEYVYLLKDKRIEEMKEFVKKELSEEI
jgi:hypothetical protein